MPTLAVKHHLCAPHTSTSMKVPFRLFKRKMVVTENVQSLPICNLMKHDGLIMAVRNPVLSGSSVMKYDFILRPIIIAFNQRTHTVPPRHPK
jgi:hypothetical protein